MQSVQTHTHTHATHLNASLSLCLSDRQVVKENHWAAVSPVFSNMCWVEIRGSHTQTDTHPCMQSKQNLKQNPQVNPVHHCAKCNNPLAEWILPAEYFPWLTLWDHRKKWLFVCACLCILWILDSSPLCQHSSSPPWRRSLSSCWPWRFSAGSTKHITNIKHQIVFFLWGCLNLLRAFPTGQATCCWCKNRLGLVPFLQSFSTFASPPL